MGSVRPLAGPVSVVLLVVVGVVTLLPDCASACSCAALPGNPQERARQALSDSAAVFSGEVVDFEESPPPTSMMEGTMFTIIGGGTATATLRVSEVWKGPKRQTAQVTTEADSAVGCGYPFEEGQEYLVYAGEGAPVSLCSETKPLSEAGAELEALGDGEVPEDGGDLSDTSGGVSVRAMAGLAGLTMAASFLLTFRLLRTR